MCYSNDVFLLRSRKGEQNVDTMEKRRRRVERMIDQRMLSFLKPVLASARPGQRKRDSLEFLSPLRELKPKREDRAS